MDKFDREVLRPATERDGRPTLEKHKDYASDVVFVTDGRTHTHLVQRDPLAGIINATDGQPGQPWATSPSFRSR